MHEPNDANGTVVGASDVRFDGGRLAVVLRNGDTVSAPLWWFPRLCDATPEERDRWVFYLVEGEGVEWPDLDEHVRIEDIVGQTGPSLESGRSFGKWLLARRAGGLSSCATCTTITPTSRDRTSRTAAAAGLPMCAPAGNVWQSVYKPATPFQCRCGGSPAYAPPHPGNETAGKQTRTERSSAGPPWRRSSR